MSVFKIYRAACAEHSVRMRAVHLYSCAVAVEIALCRTAPARQYAESSFIFSVRTVFGNAFRNILFHYDRALRYIERSAVYEYSRIAILPAARENGDRTGIVRFVRNIERAVGMRHGGLFEYVHVIHDYCAAADRYDAAVIRRSRLHAFEIEHAAVAEYASAFAVLSRIIRGVYSRIDRGKFVGIYGLKLARRAYRHRSARYIHARGLPSAEIRIETARRAVALADARRGNNVYV